MIKILLVCNAGMSTSILVEKMKKEAELKDIESKIWALSSSEARILEEDVNAVLVAPQLKFALNDIKNMFENTPVDVIDMKIYGTIDGKLALEKAMGMIKK